MSVDNANSTVDRTHFKVPHPPKSQNINRSVPYQIHGRILVITPEDPVIHRIHTPYYYF